VIESGYLGVENYSRARGHVGDSEKEEKGEEETRRGPGGGRKARSAEGQEEAKRKRSIRILDCDVKGTQGVQDTLVSSDFRLCYPASPFRSLSARQ